MFCQSSFPSGVSNESGTPATSHTVIKNPGKASRGTGPGLTHAKHPVPVTELPRCYLEFQLLRPSSPKELQCFQLSSAKGSVCQISFPSPRYIKSEHTNPCSANESHRLTLSESMRVPPVSSSRKSMGLWCRCPKWVCGSQSAVSHSRGCLWPEGDRHAV